ncbi:MAG: hypothetical protein F6K16_38995 [Symploca sp. SIO2B6]|nr:hypothetical protein [Symploca sp. SIO2B6]
MTTLMFQPGTRLCDDRYEILKPLGQGGFSQTFETPIQIPALMLALCVQLHYFLAYWIVHRLGITLGEGKSKR